MKVFPVLISVSVKKAKVLGKISAPTKIGTIALVTIKLGVEPLIKVEP